MMRTLGLALILASVGLAGSPAWAGPSSEGRGGGAIVRDGNLLFLDLEQNPAEVMTAQLVAKIQTLAQRAELGMINPQRYLQANQPDSQRAAQLLERAIEVYVALKADTTSEGQRRAERLAAAIQDTRIERGMPDDLQERMSQDFRESIRAFIITFQVSGQHQIHLYPERFAARPEREQKLIAYHAYLVASGSSEAEARAEVVRAAQPVMDTFTGRFHKEGESFVCVPAYDQAVKEARAKGYACPNQYEYGLRVSIFNSNYYYCTVDVECVRPGLL